jgi:hypothetical protein
MKNEGGPLKLLLATVGAAKSLIVEMMTIDTSRFEMGSLKLTLKRRHAQLLVMTTNSETTRPKV